MEKESFKLKGFQKLSEPVISINNISRISESARIKGDFISDDDIRIDGTVDGTIRSTGRVVVGEKATIKGRMYCGELDFWGNIEGDLYVRDLLSLNGSCVVKGSLHINKIKVEVGAQINGTIHMISEEEYDSLK